jgi:hypothetical protein
LYSQSKKEFHQGCLNLYRDFALYPLLRIMTLDEFLKEASSSGTAAMNALPQIPAGHLICRRDEARF